MDSEEYEAHIDSEVAQAQMEGVLEDDREQHDIEFTDLTNAEVLTLMTALNYGTQHFAAQESRQQAAFTQYLSETLREQAEDLFTELDEIHEPLIKRALRDEETTATSTNQSAFKRLAPPLRSPFNHQGPATLMDRAWTLGMGIILIQCMVAVTNIVVRFLGTSGGPLASFGTVTPLLVSILAFVGAVAMAFSLGAARGRATTGKTRHS